MLDHILDKALEDLAKVSHQPDVPKEQPVRKRSRSTTRQASAKKAKTWQDDFSPLVEHKLFYRVAVQSWQRQSPHVKAAEKVFVRVFHETWNYLPECDQHCLLSNWHDPASQSLGIDAAAQRHPRPLIQIVNIGEWDPTYYAVAKLGDQLKEGKNSPSPHRQHNARSPHRMPNPVLRDTPAAIVRVAGVSASARRVRATTILESRED